MFEGHGCPEGRFQGGVAECVFSRLKAYYVYARENAEQGIDQLIDVALIAPHCDREIIDERFCPLERRVSPSNKPSHIPLVRFAPTVMMWFSMRNFALHLIHRLFHQSGGCGATS